MSHHYHGRDRPQDGSGRPSQHQYGHGRPHGGPFRGHPPDRHHGGGLPDAAPESSGKAQAVQVYANLFKIIRLPTSNYYHYQVSFSPEVKIFRKRQELIHKLQNVVAADVFCDRALYDGKYSMYLRRVIHANVSFVVDLREGRSAQRRAEGQRDVHRITLTRTSGEPIQPSNLVRGNYMQSQLDPSLVATSTNILQLLIRQETDQKYTHNAHSFFSPASSKTINGGLELWRGFYQSVRPTLRGMVINVDTSMTAMYASGQLIGVALKFLGQSDVRSLALHPGDTKYHALERFFKGVRITVTSPATGRPYTKTIRGLQEEAGRFEFRKDGRSTTVEAYFDALNRRIRYPHIIGLRLSSQDAENAIIVPAELCEIVSGQMFKKRLPSDLTSDAVSFGTIPPDRRLLSIRGLGRSNELQSPIVGYNRSAHIVEAGMTVSTEPLTIAGTILRPPRLQTDGGNTEHIVQNGAWNYNKVGFVKPANLESWLFVNLDHMHISDDMRDTKARDLGLRCASLGMKISRPFCLTLNPRNITNELDNQMTAYVKYQRDRGVQKPKVDLILVILPPKSDEVRYAVKHWGDITRGILTQCVRSDKVLTAGDQYWANVALKMNARLGGYNSGILSEILKNMKASPSPGPFMIMGADVSHPGPGVLRPSVASLVWSRDEYATLYAADIRIQPPRTERIEDLQDMVKSAVDKFAKFSHVGPPKAIIFFRDGVSEAEFANIGNLEKDMIEVALRELYYEHRNDPQWKNKKTRLTFLFVVKRHHIKFFPMTPKGEHPADRTGNVKAGFVTSDEELRHPSLPDFFLQSHGAIQGTSRSGHYVVLKDEYFSNNIEAIKRLSFDLCHVYAPASRSVSIPAPVYCKLTVVHLSNASDNLDCSLF
ncbi:Piwi-domain-containing protein [Guyanagaster necrorhizus]|uniref:Piwi-domain-containing protein n=1 Tax=Guyanagaster necrorhizus TaxID=856835 RepID=A0A9P7W3P7_9AGAR|nr:Piwi-domain-containing protein [Guyanagaster necrorhizus MCA 3950]KAG7452836.1 Piwi-domain-containing protein [Guyanagaster necrorhizus MCA 3950]